MRVEHHLLRPARRDADKQHPALAQPEMRDRHRDRRAIDQHDLIAPVELMGLARRKTQRHDATRRNAYPS